MPVTDQVRGALRRVVTADSTGVRRHPLQPRNWSLSSHHERFEVLRPFVTGKTVLDLGCATGHGREDWLHGMVRDVAADIVGVDLNQSLVEKIHDDTVILGDAQQIRLGRRFQVVLAANMIEHLDSFSGLLDTASAHLEPDGVLLITTNNVFSFSNFVYRIGGTARVNPDHTCWFCRDTLRQLLERNRWTVRQVGYIQHTTPGAVRSVLARSVRSLLPEQLRWGFLYAVASPPALRSHE